MEILFFLMLWKFLMIKLTSYMIWGSFGTLGILSCKTKSFLRPLSYVSLFLSV
jgi:hypothetical protein